MRDCSAQRDCRCWEARSSSTRTRKGRGQRAKGKLTKKKALRSERFAFSVVFLLCNGCSRGDALQCGGKAFVLLRGSNRHSNRGTPAPGAGKRSNNYAFALEPFRECIGVFVHIAAAE